jgi:hypothetical protein
VVDRDAAATSPPEQWLLIEGALDHGVALAGFVADAGAEKATMILLPGPHGCPCAHEDGYGPSIGGRPLSQ